MTGVLSAISHPGSVDVPDRQHEDDQVNDQDKTSWNEEAGDLRQRLKHASEYRIDKIIIYIMLAYFSSFYKQPEHEAYS